MISSRFCCFSLLSCMVPLCHRLKHTTIVKLIRLLFIFLLYCHMVACIWYWIAQDDEYSVTWMDGVGVSASLIFSEDVVSTSSHPFPTYHRILMISTIPTWSASISVSPPRQRSVLCSSFISSLLFHFHCPFHSSNLPQSSLPFLPLQVGYGDFHPTNEAEYVRALGSHVLLRFPSHIISLFVRRLVSSYSSREPSCSLTSLVP